MKDTERALIRSSFADCHFTVLGFTNGRGDPVCCVIILACTELTAKCIMGVQPWADVVGDPMVDIEANSHGIDKFYPYGPTCVVGGKSVESYVTCSESGSITSDVLTNILKYLDQKLQFDRSEADPFLLLEAMAAVSSSHSWIILLIPLPSGRCALEPHMGRICGRLGILPNKMEHTRWL